MSIENQPIPIGPTDDLNLRVSIATLVRVVFQHPKNRDLMLALERKATFIPDAGEPRVFLKCQPFGGAIRIQSLLTLHTLIGAFHFDSERSRSEQDFRIFIRPSHWDAVLEFCLLQFGRGDDSVVESDPSRELAEEFTAALGIGLKPKQYISRPLKTVIEDGPAATDNIYARGHQTVRVYRVFEARILDPALCRMMIETSERCSNQDLRDRAAQDAHEGGKGRANAVLTLPMEPLMDFYKALSPQARNAPVSFGNNYLEGNICAILEDVPAPKYRNL